MALFLGHLVASGHAWPWVVNRGSRLIDAAARFGSGRAHFPALVGRDKIHACRHGRRFGCSLWGAAIHCRCRTRCLCRTNSAQRCLACSESTVWRLRLPASMKDKQDMAEDLNTLRDKVSKCMVPLLWLHVPLAGIVAWKVGNSWLGPCAVAAVVASIVTASWIFAPSSKSTRLTIAVAFIAMVSIILAACRGSDFQIDIHMYYFAALAILVAYCDRDVILAGAGVTAVHH